MTRSRLRLRRLLAVLGMVAVSSGPLVPAIAARSPGAVPPEVPADPAPEISASIQYEEAMAHAGDRIAFEPGERVQTPFKPRSEDRWSVGGAAPRALPAGRLSGADLQALEALTSPVGRAGGGLAGDVNIDTGRVDPLDVQAASYAIASSGVKGGTSTEAAAGTLRREVFGFLPYWEVSDTSTTLNYGLLSTIAYFSVGTDRWGLLTKTDPDGSLSTGWAGWTSSKMTSVIEAAHANGTRVVLTVACFAWTTYQAETQAALLGNPGARTQLVGQIVSAVRDRGADGVNLDFEPIVSGYADEFTALVREIRAGLDAAAPGYQLTFDTTGWIGNYPIEAATAPGGADAVFIMGYDYRGSNSNPVGSISPLTGPAYDLTNTVAAYTARVDPSKVILGVPYYGRAWSTPTDALHAPNISGEQYGYSSAVFYTTAIDYLQTYGRRWDSVEGAPWTAYHKEVCTATYGCVTTWRQLYVDDADSLGLRYDLVNQSNLRGAGIWALGYDNTRPELYQVLADKFLVDTTPPPAYGIGASYVALPPARLLDTRFGNGLSGAFSANVPRSFVVAGRGGVPADALAVTGNLTMTGASQAGAIALTPTPTASPTTSSLNFPAGDTRANGVTIALGPDGTLSATYIAPPGSTVQLIFDVTGYSR